MLISFAFISFFSLFRMEKVVTSVTKRDQIAVFKCQLRVFVIVLDMMYSSRLTHSAVPLAVLAHISVTAENCLPLCFPDSACIEIFHE